jgi:hypothetical protein
VEPEGVAIARPGKHAPEAMDMQARVELWEVLFNMQSAEDI